MAHRRSSTMVSTLPGPSLLALLLAVGCAPGGAPAPSYLKASDPQPFAQFGGPVVLSADGSTLAVGAPSASAGARNSGAVYVFVQVAGQWAQQAMLQASTPTTDGSFGSALALAADGSTLLVGAPFESSCAPSAGAVSVFTRAGAAWSQQALLQATATRAFDAFGKAVAVSADGATLAVGAWGEDSSATGVDGDQALQGATMAGAAYVFRLAGGHWTQRAYLKAANAEARDAFGGALALSSDGATLVIGASNQSSGASGVDAVDPKGVHALSSGAVYVFGDGASGWAQQAYLKASDARAGDAFGQAVAVSGTGATVAVGAFAHDGSALGSGGVYLFERTAAGWRQVASLQAASPQAGGAFGGALALSGDGTTLAVGSGGECSSATGEGGDQLGTQARGAGAVFLYAREASAWSQRGYLKASNTSAHDAFGTSVALSGDGRTVAAGAVGEASASAGDQGDNEAPSAGAVYVYRTW